MSEGLLDKKYYQLTFGSTLLTTLSEIEGGMVDPYDNVDGCYST